jgi:hypothetical protein
MSKRFKIVITEYTQEKVMRGRRWEKVNDMPETDYAYTPEFEVTEDVSREVLVQNVDSLDLVKVIKAINGIGE